MGSAHPHQWGLMWGFSAWSEEAPDAPITAHDQPCRDFASRPVAVPRRSGALRLSNDAT